MAEVLKSYSVLIAWDDQDDEKGSFGDIVRARDFDHAERIVRARMMRIQWDEAARYSPPLSKREVADNHSTTFLGIHRYFGRVLDNHEGAIWKAADLEKALRGLIAEVVQMGDWQGNKAIFSKAMLEARSLIKEIDSY